MLAEPKLLTFGRFDGFGVTKVAGSRATFSGLYADECLLRLRLEKSSRFSYSNAQVNLPLSPSLRSIKAIPRCATYTSLRSPTTSRALT